eukprot:5207743-Pyramimonas_sp.AAC.1
MQSAPWRRGPTCQRQSRHCSSASHILNTPLVLLPRCAVCPPLSPMTYTSCTSAPRLSCPSWQIRLPTSPGRIGNPSASASARRALCTSPLCAGCSLHGHTDTARTPLRTFEPRARGNS